MNGAALQWAIVLALVTVTSPASAHMPIEGWGGFYGGLLHPILVPAHALSLAALGLFIGSRGDRIAVTAVFAAALAGGLIAIALAVAETPAATVLLAGTALLGALVASAWAPPKAVAWLLAAVTGGALALDSPPQVVSIEEGNVILLATGLGACIALATVIEIAAHLRRAWQRIGVRIAGSWIAASTILALAVRYTNGDLL